MKIRRKGAGIGFTAVLLSALVATVAAPAVFASTAVTSAGTVPRGGTSTGTASFTFTENTANCFTNVAQPAALVVTILDAANNPTVTFVGPPVVSGPGTVGATATVAGNVLTIAFAGASPVNVEQITVSGLKISATATAATGAIKATLTGSEAACVLPGSTTATATLVTPIAGAGAQAAVSYNVTSVCNLRNTGSGATPAGNVSFSDVADPRSISAVSGGATSTGTQTGNFAAGTIGHPSGVTLTQTVDNCSGAIGSPGTIGNALQQTVLDLPTPVLVGENSQPVARTRVAEYPLGDEITLGGTITFTITTAGVTFSGAPTANPTGDISLGALLPTSPPAAAQGLGTSVACSLSVDRKSCSVTVTSNQGTAGVAGAPFTAGPPNHYCPAVSSVCGDVTLQNITVDADGTAVPGSKVIITATTSAPLAVVSNVVGFVGRVIFTTAAQPVVFIGKNDQKTGTITLTEQATGFFTAGPGATNFFAICYTTGETFTREPWAVVQSGTDLTLTSGLVGVTQAKGTLIVISGNACAYWQVFHASTTAPATIKIVGSADGTTPLDASVADNGPRINVPSNLSPGSSQAALLVGPSTSTLIAFQFLSNAIRAFQADQTVTVTAASQPRCLPGATDCLAGNLVVTERANGSLKSGMIITVNVLPRATTQRNDVLLQTTSTNQTPIATANTAQSGLLVTPVGVTCTPSAILGIVVCNFAVTVTQQSFGPALGTITFSNIHYVVAADAINGPVNVDVTGIPLPGPGHGQIFDVVVSNAIIGAAPVVITTKTSAASAIGKTNNSILFTVGTKVIHVVSTSNNIATIRIQVAPALVGKSVAIEVASKNSAGVWSAFTKLTTRVIGGDGFAYYYASTKTAKWLSFRGFFAGDTTHSSSRSQTVQIHWVSP